MLDRKKDRWLNSYNYFFGGLSEEEQQYRDYFETDCEKYPENEKTMEVLDEMNLANSGEFAFKGWDFQED